MSSSGDHALIAMPAIRRGSSDQLPVSYAVQGEKSSPKWASAFAAGCGGVAVTDDVLRPGPVALFGSPARQRLLNEAIADGREFFYGDHGYFRRGRYFRITKNGYQHDGRGTHPSDRLEALHLNRVHGWNSGGSAIIVCPNSPTYMAFFGMDAKAWTMEIVSTLETITDRPVVIRWKSQAQARPLYVDLADAWIVVVFSSASAVEALIGGIPVCTLAPWASTARMGITDIRQVESPIYPEDRDQFLFNLAYQQWTLDEMREGLAWKALANA